MLRYCLQSYFLKQIFVENQPEKMLINDKVVTQKSRSRNGKILNRCFRGK